MGEQSESPAQNGFGDTTDETKMDQDSGSEGEEEMSPEGECTKFSTNPRVQRVVFRFPDA